MRSRWSPSLFDDTHRLTGEQLDTLLTAAQWAPSWGNAQPWTMLVCERGGAAHDELVATLTRGNADWVPRASVVFVTAAHVRGTDAASGKDPSGRARYDTGQAAAHLTLQAQAMGLHAHQFAGFDHEAFARTVGVPETHDVLTGIAVGVPVSPPPGDERTAARERRGRVRRTLPELARAGRWETPWRPSGASDPSRATCP